MQFPNQVWGCVYNNETDHQTLNLLDPYETDTVMIPAHSWGVIRVRFDNPGKAPAGP